MERIEYWTSHGAQPSERVTSLITEHQKPLEVLEKERAKKAKKKAAQKAKKMAEKAAATKPAAEAVGPTQEVTA